MAVLFTPNKKINKKKCKDKSMNKPLHYFQVDWLLCPRKMVKFRLSTVPVEKKISTEYKSWPMLLFLNPLAGRSGKFPGCSKNPWAIRRSPLPACTFVHSLQQSWPPVI